MTGFGRAEKRTGSGSIRVELKTVNHKFLEISSRLPGHLNEYEDAVRRQIGQGIRRGKVNLFIAAPDPSAFSVKLVLNEPLAKEVFHKIERLRNVLQLKHLSENRAMAESATLTEVLHYPDVLKKDSSSDKQNFFLKELTKVVDEALKNLSGSREAEGRALMKDLSGRLSEMKKSLKTIEKRIPAVAREYRASLHLRMKDYLKDAEIDKERLTGEVAQFVKNSDISEEVTRLATHINGMGKTFKEPGELGRKIDFIAQEMFRETNTMGAKSSDVTISNAVINLKSVIEKIREQAQNIE